MYTVPPSPASPTTDHLFLSSVLLRHPLLQHKRPSSLLLANHTAIVATYTTTKPSPSLRHTTNNPLEPHLRVLFASTTSLASPARITAPYLRAASPTISPSSWTPTCNNLKPNHAWSLQGSKHPANPLLLLTSFLLCLFLFFFIFFILLFLFLFNFLLLFIFHYLNNFLFCFVLFCFAWGLL